MLNVLASEPTCTTLWCDYVHTQFDPAHLLSELGFSILFEVIQILFITLFYRRVIKPRLFKQVHAEIDAEHGIEHHDNHIHHASPEQPCNSGSTPISVDSGNPVIMELANKEGQWDIKGTIEA